MVAATALLCYALVIHREARGEPLPAQIAAAKTLHNRAVKSHQPVCTELTKKRQFSFVRKYGIAKPNGKRDVSAWQRSRKLARTFQKMKVKGITPKHLYFNTLALGKRYKTKTKPVIIGQLIFY